MSRILKALDPSVPALPPVGPGQVLPRELHEARAEASALLAGARAEVAAARAALRALVDGARAEAEAEGREAGLGRVAEDLARLARARQEWLAQVEAEVVALGVAVAEKVLDREVRERGAAVDIARGALGALRRARSLTLRLHPDDLPTVRAAEPQLLERLAPGAALSLVEDDTLSRGSALLESELGRVDARLETQLGALRRALLDAAGAQ